MIIFCDGVFDCFHYGHVNHFKKIKELYKGCYLIVGVLNDKESTSYKRKPIFNENKRLKFVESCKYVDKALLDYPPIITKEFMDKYNIDIVVHAFSNENDIIAQKKYFIVPIKLNKFKIIDYNLEISTTNILKNIENIENSENSENIKNKTNKKDWDLIWELKGNKNDNNPFNLNGYDDTNYNPQSIFTNIVNKFNINNNEKICEFGCGAGLISQYFDKKYDYYGIDYSQSLILKNIKLFNSKVYNCEAKDTPYKDKYFDYSFCVGVFEYFPNKEYAKKVIEEMIRVTKKGIFIINIRKKTHTKKQNKHKFDGVFTHLIYNENEDLFKDFTLCDASYEKDKRFSVFKKLF